MWSFIKKLLSVLIVLWIVALVLNLKIGGRGTREWTSQVWESEGVQKVYTTVRDRIVALVRKDISVEEVFKPDISNPAQPTSSKTKEPSVTSSPEQIQKIDLEKLDEKDRQALERILEKSK